MKELSSREKKLGLVLGVLVIFSAVWLAKDHLNLDLLGRELKVKKNQLVETKLLVSLAKDAIQIGPTNREQTGLQGRIISDTLAGEIKDLDLLKKLNEARRSSDLATLHPSFREKANFLIDFREQKGGTIESIDQLKEIQGPIFVGEQPEAIIARQISRVASGADVKSNYQLNIKKQPGKKLAKIANEAKSIFVNQLYLDALNDELANLEAEQDQLAEEAENAVSSMMNFWDVDENNENEDSEETEAEIEMDSNRGEDNVKKVHNGFHHLPSSIPLDARVDLIDFIKAEIQDDLWGISKRKEGLIADQLNLNQADVKGYSPLKKNSILLDECEILLEDYGSNDDSDQLAIRDFTNYVNHTHQRHRSIRQSLDRVSDTHQPNHYIVTMKFQGQIEQVSRFIYAVENSLRWLQVKDFKIVVADKKKNQLGFDLTLVANIL
ncbi:hypothetical protein CMK19_13700 [Candidatus Poribacteria bacterium]|nr:hypothetical protein [Candidatus Poribacteria bacterium]|tara:strand:- start:917 stop:2230 length:1314 start_codon:yes stop_codon:yes gene_type:complete